MEIGGVLVEVLYPEAYPPISDNNHSVVLRLTFGQRSFLLTGDIEAATETEFRCARKVKGRCDQSAAPRQSHFVH